MQKELPTVSEQKELSHLQNPVKTLLQMGGMVMPAQRECKSDKDAEEDTGKVDHLGRERRKTANWDDNHNLINEG
jgi:hypothetical protein